MLPKTQEFFARSVYSEQKHQEFLDTLEKKIGIKIEFRVLEAPVFVSNALKEKLERYSTEILMECVSPDYLKKSDGAMEERYTVRNQDAHPMFAVVDFAVTRNENGDYEPRLVELQGFPSLLGYQYVYAKTAMDFYRINANVDYTFSGLSDESYLNILRSALLGKHQPDNACLLEYHPEEQKTRPDFLALRSLVGLGETDICSVRKEGNKIFHQRNGEWKPIHRIFNRAIIDELDEQNVTIPFAWNDDLDVEWAGHPNWYFRISKYSMAFLKHHAVPRTTFLNELDAIPTDLDNYVLKPLYAFAGKGVIVAPTEQDIRAVPAEERAKFILQERNWYDECLYTPEGMNKAELRVLMVWLPEWEKPLPVMSLARTGRGPMMGVRFNSIPWTGSAGCLFAEEDFGAL